MNNRDDNMDDSSEETGDESRLLNHILRRNFTSKKSKNPALVTPKKSFLDISEITHSPIRDSMNSVQRSIKKMVQHVNLMERNSPRKASKRNLFDRTPNTLPSFSTVNLCDSKSTSESHTSSSSSHSPETVPETQKPGIQDSLESQEDFDFNEGSIEGIDSLLDNFVKNSRKDIFSPKKTSEDISRKNDNKKIGLKLFKADKTVADIGEVIVDESSSDDEEILKIRKSCVNETVARLKSSPVKGVRSPAKSAKSPKEKDVPDVYEVDDDSEGEVIRRTPFKKRLTLSRTDSKALLGLTDSDDDSDENVKASIFKKRPTLARKNVQALVPDSDDELEDENYHALKSSKIFKNRQTIDRKAARVLAKDSDEERDNENDEIFKPSNIFKTRQTMDRKAARVLAKDSDDDDDEAVPETQKNINNDPIKLQKHVMSEESEEEEATQQKQIKRPHCNDEDMTLNAKDIKKAPLKLKFFRNSPVKKDLISRTNQNSGKKILDALPKVS